jgi:hypothetical protein
VAARPAAASHTQASSYIAVSATPAADPVSANHWLV